MLKLWEFLFDRWKKEILNQGIETWQTTDSITGYCINEYKRNYVDYRYTNKFDGSTKIKREYLN